MADRSLFGKLTEDRYLANNRRKQEPPNKATSKWKEHGDDVDFNDLEVLKFIVDFHSTKGIFPFENREAMQSFLRPFLIKQLGNEYGWKMKLEHLETKFKMRGPLQGQEWEEFKLWKRIWGNEGGGGDGRGGSSSSAVYRGGR